MRRRNGCNFFIANAAVTELDRAGIVVEPVIDMVTVGRAKSKAGQHRSMGRVGVMSAWQGGFRMRVLGSKIASAAVAAALIFDSTAGIAASARPATAPQASQASWLTLSMLSPSGAIGLAGAAAQPATDVPPPPPPPGPPPPPEDNAYQG